MIVITPLKKGHDNRKCPVPQRYICEKMNNPLSSFYQAGRGCGCLVVSAAVPVPVVMIVPG